MNSSYAITGNIILLVSQMFYIHMWPGHVLLCGLLLLHAFKKVSHRSTYDGLFFRIFLIIIPVNGSWPTKESRFECFCMRWELWGDIQTSLNASSASDYREWELVQVWAPISSPQFLEVRNGVATLLHMSKGSNLSLLGYDENLSALLRLHRWSTKR